MAKPLSGLCPCGLIIDVVRVCCSALQLHKIKAGWSLQPQHAVRAVFYKVAVEATAATAAAAAAAVAATSSWKVPLAFRKPTVEIFH